MNKAFNHGKGIVALRRVEKTFSAGFGIIKADLATAVEYLPFLHQKEKAYYDSLKPDNRKNSYLIGRMAAKSAIRMIIEDDRESMGSIHIDQGVFHFPVVKSSLNRNLQVSISHCGNIAIALAFPEEHPLAIDIERMDGRHLAAVKNCMTPGEHAHIAGSGVPGEMGYTLLWTVKEALSKIFRTGLTLDFKSFEIKSFERKGDLYVSSFCHYIQYKALSIIGDEFLCSVIMPRNTEAEMGPLVRTFRQFCGGDEYKAASDR